MTLREKCCGAVGDGGISSVSTSGCITGDGTLGSPITLLINPSGGISCSPQGLKLGGDGCSLVTSYEAGVAPSGATAPANPTTTPVENTVQIEVYDDCIYWWAYSGGGWVLDKKYCPASPSGQLVSATTDGYQRRHGRTDVPSGSTITLGSSTSYVLSGSGIYGIVSGGDASRDGDVIRVSVGSLASLLNSWQSGGNIKLDGTLGTIVNPSGGANVTLWYDNTASVWEETSRVEF